MKSLWIMITGLVVLAPISSAQVTPLDSGRVAIAKAVIDNLWTASQVYYQDKGEWPRSVADLVEHQYLEVDSTKLQGWRFTMGGCYPETFRASSEEQAGSGECPECPKYVITYDILLGRWRGSGIPRYGVDTLSVQTRAELCREARNAMRDIWEAAKVFYQDKGVWPVTVEQLDEGHYIGVRSEDYSPLEPPSPGVVTSSTFNQWRFAMIGEPPQTIVAISTKQMPGGEGRAILYDATSGVWKGYGAVDAQLVPPSPVQYKEYKKQRR